MSYEQGLYPSTAGVCKQICNLTGFPVVSVTVKNIYGDTWEE